MVIGNRPAVYIMRLPSGITRTLLISLTISMPATAGVSHLLSQHENHLITAAGLMTEYAIYYTVFAILFYTGNHARLGKMERGQIRREMYGMVVSFGVSEIIYIIIRYVMMFYLLEAGMDAYLASIISEGLCTMVWIMLVCTILKKTRKSWSPGETT